jgi:hypothetical protein
VHSLTQTTAEIIATTTPWGYLSELDNHLSVFALAFQPAFPPQKLFFANLLSKIDCQAPK